MIEQPGNDTTVGTKDVLADYVQYVRPRSSNDIIHAVIYFITCGVLILFIIGFIAMLLTDLSAASAVRRETASRLLGNPWLYVLLYAALMGVFKTKDLARRYYADHRSRLLNDRRPPILYLRPFFDENRDKNEAYLRDNSDMLLAKALSPIAPLIAIGRPGDGLPPSGAIRLYFRDDEWQEKAIQLIKFSRFVILQPAFTDAVEWEIATVREHLKPQQLLFSFLSWRNLSRSGRWSEYESFKIHIQSLCGFSLPEYSDEALFLSFNDDWTPYLIKAQGIQRLLLKLSSLSNFTWKFILSPGHWRKQTAQTRVFSGLFSV